MKTQATLWTVHNAASAGGTQSPSAAVVTAAEQELRRLGSIAALVELPGEIVGEHLPEQIARWYHPWRRRFAASRARLAWHQALEGVAKTQGADAVEAEKLDAAVAQLDERLGMSAAEARRLELTHHSAGELFELDRGQRPARFYVRGASPQLELTTTSGASSNWPGRLVASLAVSLIGLAGIVALRQRSYPRLSASAVLAALGVIWWWLFAPSVLGLVVVLFAVWIGVLEWGRPAIKAVAR
jgi:hypothetical protein